MSFNLIEWFQLNNLQDQQEQTNELLGQIRQLQDQIRRNQLSPAERAQEDAAAKLAWEKDKWGRFWRRMW